MPAAGRTVFIAGAGIAGLTLALALAKFGTSVVVLERNAAVTEVGAGVQISPNARRVLNRLGLDRHIAAQSLEPVGIDVYPSGARAPLVTLSLGEVVRERYGVPYAVMHRGDLADILHRACRRFANIDIAFGVSNFELAGTEEGVTVSFDTGDARRTARGFAFVGADGVQSATRTAILHGPAASETGTVAWRAMVDMAALKGHLALDRTSLFLRSGFHAVCYPLPHRALINVAVFAPQTAADADSRQPPLLALSNSDDRIAALLASAGDGWTQWPLSTVTAAQWHRGNIGLVGDAAHAMLPFQAQGAAMAIEDAAILAPLLMTEPSAETAFARFAAMRQPRVSRVARVSERNGSIFHMSGPLALARNLAIRLQGRTGHLKRLDWLYGYDAAPEVESGANRP